MNCRYCSKPLAPDDLKSVPACWECIWKNDKPDYVPTAPAKTTRTGELPCKMCGKSHALRPRRYLPSSGRYLSYCCVCEVLRRTSQTEAQVIKKLKRKGVISA